VAFIGRPNVGKSSLLNALLGEDRAIVSDIPGTTRDAIDTRLAWGRSEVVLIDTAGIRRRGKVASGPAAERYSTLRALHALSRADVAVLVIDAVEGLTSQDAHVAGYVIEEGKGLVIAVNKWDLVADKTDKTFDQYIEWIRNEVPFLDFAPIISISAKTGQRVGRVLETAIDIWGERRKRISTGELNRIVIAAIERTPPPPVRGHRPKLFYATQAAVAPPTFVFFASDASAVHFSYRRFLENRLRESFGFDGTPIRLVFRDRSSVKLPRRKKLRSAPVSTGRGARRSAPAGRARKPT
jgi:GTP-binding protein